jgi:hypothetical protein
MASRKRKKMTAYASGRAATAKKSRKKAKSKRGTSPLARMAHARGLTIAQLRHEVEACGRWSVRRRKSTTKNPCR